MTTISASVVKELRDKTGAGMMDCKRALAETGGDVEAAKDWLRKRGQAIADKKAARKASEGLIHCIISNGTATMLELNCETDFVARNEQFGKLLRELAAQIHAGGPGTQNGNVDELMEAPSLAAPGQKISEHLRAMIANIGENLGIGRFVRIEAGGDKGYFQSYIHPPGKLGVLILLETGKAESASRPELSALAVDLAMHAAAAAPDYLDRASVPADALDREREIYRAQVLNEGKPEKIADKIVEGKLAKFYQQRCLLEQEFVKEPSLTIQKLIDAAAKTIGDTIRLVRFERMKVGG